LLFRVGDFYETFGEDAIKASGVLGIILTKRNNGGSDVELAGFPHHSLDIYLPKLVKAGYRVAICEQLEKPSKEKKIVKRGVTEVVTPGIAIDDKLLHHKTNNYLASIYYDLKTRIGIALLDISTGEFLVAEGNEYYLDKILKSFNPSEIILSKSQKKQFLKRFGEGYYHFGLDEWIFTTDYTSEKLLDFFKVNTLKGFGIENMDAAHIAAGSILHYLESNEQTNVRQVHKISRIHTEDFIWLDRFTIANLELIDSNHATGVPLIQILDRTTSPMGARMMKKWTLMPLVDKSRITARLDKTEFLLRDQELRNALFQSVKQIGDLERLVSKIPMGKINPRELRQLSSALSKTQDIKSTLSHTEYSGFKALADIINPCTQLQSKINESIVDEPPVSLLKGEVIKLNISQELDELKYVVSNSKDLLIDIQKTESEKTGITNLKIGFNNVFGYYLEVTNKYKDRGLVPDNWIRKQTLTNAERYITEELKQLEAKILGAEEKISVIEAELFADLVQYSGDYIESILITAKAIAELDCLLSFSILAEHNKYCKPIIDDTKEIDIKNGRHPVIEKHLPLGEAYVPNDIYLSNDDQQIIMITGPNMSGKSAILRQTALIVIMAQMGCYVPAEYARIGIVDKLFTRVGASDNISSGESTFMVEMNETASIMNNISSRSLILLDEIGRGTSTYDGISIAWSIAEYLHEHDDLRPKTLFATHYHELNELSHSFNRIKNFNVSTKEVGTKVIFLRKLVEGGSKHSFGIHVAKMAGMPKEIVKRASTLLGHLEEKALSLQNDERTIEKSSPSVEHIVTHQLGFFDSSDERSHAIIDQLELVDINSMTPIECMMKLHELKKLMEE
ncbi:MAG: DNA mismatch repair protein MutS, partial [Bacteroidia bacterium]|nr:DNA mismatch repair protein MutS [Bacteroidia bacterium]